MPFNSFDFQQFCKSWDIYLSTSSPEYPQSNGQAERCVQTLKNFLRKAEEDGSDPYIALLEYRNTPISGLQYAPAQLAMSRLLRSRIPATHMALKPRVIDVHEQLIEKQNRYKQQYDKHAHPLPSLEARDVIRYRKDQRWEPAVVEGRYQVPRSYIIRGESGILRRNRRHLMKTAEQPPIVVPYDSQVPELSSEEPRQTVEAPNGSENTKKEVIPVKKGTTFAPEVVHRTRPIGTRKQTEFYQAS